MKLRELSTHLGLSQTTVSRALNGYPEVSSATRARVIEAARRFGYRPDPNALRLATGRSGVIGMIFPAERSYSVDPLFAEYLAGVGEATARRGLDVLMSATSQLGEEVAYRRAAREKRVDGVLLSGPFVQDPRIAALREMNLPFAVHGRTRSAHHYPYLDIDNEGAFAAATRHLLERGHRRVALINGEHRFNFAADREQGYRGALVAGGLRVDARLIHEGVMNEENGARATALLLDMERPPSAILCSSMVMALGVVRVLRERGRRAGRDMALVAHDDGLPFLRPEHFDPPLTTTRSSIRDAGRRVTEMLIAHIDGSRVENLQEVWPVELVVRDSTPAPVPARIDAGE